jgi:hypothetical protein
MNAGEALAKLYTADRDGLYEMVYDAHKDQYGVKGRHMHDADKEQLINWWIQHYTWNEEGQYWDSRIPFDDNFPASLWSDEDEEDDSENPYVQMLNYA